LLADQAEKAMAQLRRTVQELLVGRLSMEKAEELARVLTEGTWTHDYPISCDEAGRLGLPVSTDMPATVLRLMALFPQPVRRQPSVEYLPELRRFKREAGMGGGSTGRPST
jgi:ClpP class serine protease